MKFKRGQAEYAWIFSLIVGGLILFLAIFAAQRFKGTASIETQSELLREFDLLLNPFSSVGGITTMTLSKSVELPAVLQMNFSCNSRENYNELNLRVRSGRNWGDWLRQGFRIRDKYIFSEPLEGRRLWIFSKPFEMPWRVDDVIYITDKSYCFDNPPDEIVREVDSLKTNAVFVKEKDVCPPESIEVCFGSRDCDINVNYELGVVRKGENSILFTDDALMYAAIFSDIKLYSCNLERLHERLKTQVEINLDKALVLESRGCNTQALQVGLQNMKRALESDKGKFSAGVFAAAREVEDENPNECPVFD